MTSKDDFLQALNDAVQENDGEKFSRILTNSQASRYVDDNLSEIQNIAKKIKDWDQAFNIVANCENINVFSMKTFLEYVDKAISSVVEKTDLFNLLYRYFESEIKKGEFSNLAKYGVFRYGELIPNTAKEAQAIYSKYESIYKIQNAYLANIEISNFHCIKNISIQNIENHKEIYFLGENGVGKTLLLQSIIMGIYPNSSERLLFTARQLAENPAISRQLYPDNQALNSFVVAYGVSRLRHHDSVFDETGYGTLFDRQTVNLKDPIKFLEDIERKELKGLGLIKLSDVILMMTSILNIEDPNEIKIEAKGADFVFYERNTEVKFEHLADGYRSILLVLADLLYRLIENQPYITKLADFRGVVLIDEVDMLLHPKWAYCIVQKLTSKFKNIQWFFTTHSPSLVMGASKDAVFYRLYKEDGKTEISQQYKYADISNLLSNSILTSPLFGMEYSGMREQLVDDSIDVDTSDDYLSSRIHRQIKQRIAEQKATNSSSYISDELINKWIAEALAEGGE